MKTKNVFSRLIIGSLFLLPLAAYAQDRSTMSKDQIDKMDSVELATMKAGELQKANDQNRMDEAKLNRKQTKAKAKDAKRVEEEASNAARESKAELRAEKKAQKSRKEATKQAKTASDARDKSNEN
jgi:hypothetical protein